MSRARKPGATHPPGRRMPATLILAAGKGTRLGEVGRRRAKALIPIRGRPLLDLHLDHLARQGVRRVVVNAHHLSDQIVEHINRYHGPLQITTLVEAELLGTAGAAVNALPALGGSPFLVLYGDVLLFEPLAPLMRTHADGGAAATLAVYESERTGDKGVVDVDRDDAITGFAEKDPSRTGPGLVNAGLYVVEARLLDDFPRQAFLDFGQDVFPAALRAGHRLQAHRISRPVLDIGTPQDLARSEAHADESPF